MPIIVCRDIGGKQTWVIDGWRRVQAITDKFGVAAEVLVRDLGERTEAQQAALFLQHNTGSVKRMRPYDIWFAAVDAAMECEEWRWSWDLQKFAETIGRTVGPRNQGTELSPFVALVRLVKKQYGLLMDLAPFLGKMYANQHLPERDFLALVSCYAAYSSSSRLQASLLKAWGKVTPADIHEAVGKAKRNKSVANAQDAAVALYDVASAHGFSRPAPLELQEAA